MDCYLVIDNISVVIFFLPFMSFPFPPVQNAPLKIFYWHHVWLYKLDSFTVSGRQVVSVQ